MTRRGPSQKSLFQVWGALLVLLFLTWGVAEFNLGPWNIIAAIGIAVVKMLLVVLIFMQVRYSSKLTWLYVAAGLFWLSLMVILTMTDYLTRGLLRL